MKFLTLLIGSSLLVVIAGCGPAAESNSNNAANTASANGIQNVDPKDLPPGLSASPMAPVGNANAVNAIAPGGTPTPGIPDPKTLGKPMKPGVTPTPGIPDEATIKRQMEQMRKAMNSNVNQPPPPAGAGDGQMMRKKPRATNTNN